MILHTKPVVCHRPSSGNHGSFCKGRKNVFGRPDFSGFQSFAALNDKSYSIVTESISRLLGIDFGCFLLWQRRWVGQICKLIENTSKLPLVSPLWSGCLGQPQHRPWVTQRCWGPWPPAGLLGTKRSLASCGELQEIHFSLWFPALEPVKTAQPVAAFRKRA